MSLRTISSLLFATSATVTIVWGSSMAAMGGMPMPGGWTMSMAWMRMPGQSFAYMAMSFLGMWVVMMMAMMLPSLVPMLRRYREVIGVMDLRAMAVVTAAITTERLAPAGERVARAIGAVCAGAGMVLLARAAGSWSG